MAATGAQSDPSEEFGGPLFPDEDPDAAADRPDDTGERKLRFGPNDTGPLPHWTEPPTGEIPRMAPAASGAGGGDDDEDVDVWSSFTTESPVWRDDVGDDDPSGGLDRDLTGEVRADSLSEPLGRPGTGEIPLAPPPRREPDGSPSAPIPSGVPAGRLARPPRRRAAQQRSGRPAGPARTSATARRRRATCRPPIAAGVVLAALFIVATLWRPVGVARPGRGDPRHRRLRVLRQGDREGLPARPSPPGWRPASPRRSPPTGSARGALPLVVAFAFIAGAVGFIGASGVESGPLPNMAVTTMGVVWIGLLGSFAALIVRWSNQGPASRTSAPTRCS